MFWKRGEPLCRKIQGMLSEYIDDRLDNEKKTIVERHLESCETCSHELSSLQMTVQLLHRVSEVPAPRSFTIAVPQPTRERVFGPSSLRWLRPATVVATIALVALLMIDFVPAFQQGGGVNEASRLSVATSTPSGEGNVTMGGEIVAPPAPTQDGTEKDGKDVIQPLPTTVPQGEEAFGPLSPSGEQGKNWPLRQIEIGVGALIVVLAALTVFAIRQRGKRVGVR